MNEEEKLVESATAKLDKSRLTIKEGIKIIRNSRTNTNEFIRDGLTADEAGALLNGVINSRNMVIGSLMALGILVAILLPFVGDKLPEGAVERVETIGQVIAPDDKAVVTEPAGDDQEVKTPEESTEEVK